MACALIGRFLNAEHLRLERRADRRQEIVEWSIQRPFLGRAPGRPDSSKVGEVAFGHRRQLRGRSAHRSGCCLTQRTSYCRIGSQSAACGADGPRGALHVGASRCDRRTRTVAQGIRYGARGGAVGLPAKEDFTGSDPYTGSECGREVAVGVVDSRAYTSRSCDSECDWECNLRLGTLLPLWTALRV